ncbi:alcohol dehydrogenase catalytic domain-containing protein [Alicyclobacillus sp. SO9]|uniref:alcohol dehydrogenase catalytic domain-containing protein n=1 Tax=Alicyclobacillus sp. SO9 TaxID=2665646 RepID=UPI0018E8198A|nr:alcohol dehydrogenase catalytic domain-containing protein [Alicyclobacillus sp. SO9]QQE76852.1 alcohol dehydrogenase catalytic domain-containing protein [Alicyclobacillus sp. SO9]
MKAAFFSPDTGFTITDTSLPRAGVNEAVVQVEACGICGSDKQLVRGEAPPQGTEFPVVLGHEIAGRIHSVVNEDPVHPRWTQGESVLVYPFIPCGECRLCQTGLSHLCSKQQVIGYHRQGGFAEQTVVPVSNLILRPSGISASAGALLVDAFATPYHALKQGALSPGECILVLGAGGLGLAGLMVAKAMGAKRIGLLSRRRAALDNPAADYAEARFDAGEGDRQVGRQIRRWSKGGVDVILDTTGSGKLIEQGLDLLHPGGRLVIIGMNSNEFTLPVAKTVRRGISVIASYGSTKQDVEELAGFAQDKRILPENLVVQRVALAEVAQAFTMPGKPGRTVIVP